MDRFDERVVHLEKLCASEFGVAEPEVVAVTAPPQNASMSGSGSLGVQSDFVVPIRKKPQEFDGKVSWEAYQIQFEMLADQNNWDERQKVVQLAKSLKVPALDMLSQLSVADWGCCLALIGALERKYGVMCQSETYWACFLSRVRARGEPLQQLAQDLESMVRRAYPTASPELLALLKEQFVDALDSANLKVQVKQ